LLEARTTPGTDSTTLDPQLIFDGHERLIYRDQDDLGLGKEEVENRFYGRLQSAYRHYCLPGPNARKREHRCHC
jgi:hypothetical protein